MASRSAGVAARVDMVSPPYAYATTRATAAAAATHIDGPCGTVALLPRDAIATAHSAVRTGAASAANTQASNPNDPGGAPAPIASLTSPAPMPAGAARCTPR